MEDTKKQAVEDDFIYDIKTPNKSFIYVAKQLKDRGVKNNKFMLKLYDRSLVGVDPHDPNISHLDQLKVYREVCRNKWYYLREVIRIPDTGSEKGRRYMLNLGNLAQSWAISHNLNFWSILPRQIGKTLGTIADHTWIMLFNTLGCQMIYMNKSFSDAVENGRRFKMFKELLPDYLRRFITDRKLDKDNVIEKFFGKRKNQLLVKSSAVSEKMADQLGRGLTCAIWYQDEAAFNNHMGIIYDACVPAQRTAAMNAERNNVPYGIHFTTTPNNKDTREGKWAYEFLEECAKFRFEMYDMTEKEMREYILANGKRAFVHIQYSWKEVGRTQEWYDGISRDMSSRLKILRELDLVWVNSSDNSVFGASVIERLNQYRVDNVVYTLKINTELVSTYIDFYEVPDFKLRYILSCDVGGGVGADRSVMLVLHPDDFRVVGIFKQPNINTAKFRILLQTLMLQYFLNGLLVVESNSYGNVILEDLGLDKRIEHRIYRSEIKDETKYSTDRGAMVRSGRRNFRYGVNTNPKSRKTMFDMLDEIVNVTPHLIRSPELISEIGSLAEIRGKIQASPGTHDDVVMAYLVGRYAIDSGNFFRQFGVDKSGFKPSDHALSSASQANKFINSMLTFDSANGHIDIGMSIADAPELLMSSYVEEYNKESVEERYDRENTIQGINSIINFNSF